MNAIYHWPSAAELYPDYAQKSRRLKRLRFNLRTLTHYFFVRRFSECTNQNKELAKWLVSRPSYSYPLVHRFLDKRFNTLQRFYAMRDNLDFLPRKLAEFKLPPLWLQPLAFGEIVEGFELRLNVNEFQPMEGFWALELRERQPQKVVYLLTFGKVKEALLIAVIQGPNFDGSKEFVKRLTKQCHGLRPMHLMIEAMKALTAALGYEKLWGIPQKYQNKSRFVQRKRYTVDYDVIFAESGAVLSDYWQIPLQHKERDLNEVPSKKRSMYRKREELIQRLHNMIAEKFA